MKKIVLTGGGTAGHVNPNVALIPFLKEKGYHISYIGSKEGIEKNLIKPLGIDYYEISTGKLRRYLDFKNITDSFRVVKGISDATSIIKKIKPNIIFSKGGFVSVPVVIGGYFNKVPVIIHESDISPGLANKLSIPFSKKVCATFPEALQNIPKDKAILTGTPIREELFKGSKEKGYKLCNFKDTKPIILIMGGSLGSVKINMVLRQCLDNLLKDFNIIHLCGKNNLDNNINVQGYYQLEYAKDELKHLLAVSDLIISRAGSNAICEILALKKPNLLIPLSKNASRGDQILNANSFKKQGFSTVLYEEDLSKDSLKENIYSLYNQKTDYINAMNKSYLNNSINKILEQIDNLCKY
ncbi:undecaprenyldiphospho-muramoylpentapeptide beta-N-acetylglucosaminyltransferase [uncultured Tyzzerella sp.]|uniref:undecaprenyldiphospho-muramoylpentapeptide beta-N-acetylglucosaminyltransferase n=1 Tax=uncultured Tyzzerella sp. TaxID=2321398 RepID=UPI00294398F4|nr:undecaprenyldiphospho-muramoylpentapeptide beta-N-acetylglucosaminyltransferase [uncultured Tyzzerella sp.]